MWNDLEIDITRKTSNSYEVTTDDIRRAARLQPENPRSVCPTVSSFVLNDLKSQEALDGKKCPTVSFFEH